MSTVHRLRAAAVAISCAIAFGAVILTAAPPAVAASSCVPTMLIGVHGTGEETGVIGNELASLYNGVVGHTGLPEQGLSGWKDDSNLFVDVAAGVVAYPADGGLTLDAALGVLQAAVDAGATDLYNQVSSESSQCPNEHFVIAGFSQGAAVVGEFARNHPELAGRVSGVTLWADPDFNGNDSYSKGAVVNASGFTGTGGWLGVLGWYHNQRLTFPSAWSGLLRSYCTTLDPVCNWSLSNFAGWAHHGDERYAPIITDSESAIDAASGGWAPSVWDNGGTNTFYTEWQNTGGVGGTLGQPSADPGSKPGGGIIQTFAGSACGSSTGSAIMWSAASRTHEMHGCIYSAFISKWGGPGGAYGYPTSDEEPTRAGTGRINYMSGTLCGTSSGSALVYSAAGTFPVHGCIYQRYSQIGEDASGIGLPTSDEYSVSGGVQQNYSNGNIRDLGGSITVTVYNSTGLDDTDPYQTGCAGSAHPESTVAATKDGPTVIDLQWSGYCGTNWTRVIPNINGGSHLLEMAIWVERQESGGSITSSDTFTFWPNGTVPAWSDQLYAPVLHARACENYYDVPDKVWSTPVCTGWV